MPKLPPPHSPFDQAEPIGQTDGGEACFAEEEDIFVAKLLRESLEGPPGRTFESVDELMTDLIAAFVDKESKE